MASAPSASRRTAQLVPQDVLRACINPGIGPESGGWQLGALLVTYGACRAWFKWDGHQ